MIFLMTREIDTHLSLDDYTIKNKSRCFFIRVLFDVDLLPNSPNQIWWKDHDLCLLLM